MGRKRKSVQKLTLPVFYCNLSKCRNSLIEANVILNDVHLCNQLMEHTMSCLKHVVLRYDSSEHNRYLSLNGFCSSYAHLFRVWDELKVKNVQIILDNVMYDAWKYSVHKQQVSHFLEYIYHKQEVEIRNEKGIYFDANRFADSKSSENAFVCRIAERTGFFRSTG